VGYKDAFFEWFVVVNRKFHLNRVGYKVLLTLFKQK